MLLSDPCLSMPEVLQRYHWFYEKNLNCLCVFPVVQNLSQSAQKLWKSFIKTVAVLDKPEAMAHSFLFHPDSVRKLMHEFKPHTVWLCVEPQYITGSWDENIYTSPSPEGWLQKPLTKKHVWKIWQNILAV
jgi:hypothetical protein